MFVHRFVAPIGAIFLAAAPTTYSFEMDLERLVIPAHGFQMQMGHTFLGGATPAGRPTQSSPIAHSADGKLLLNCNPDDNSVSLLSTTDTTVRRIAKINVGEEPVSVAITPNRRRAFVANARDGTVSELDLRTRTVVRTLNVGTEPTALALSPNATRLYVSNSLSNSVTVFDVAATPALVTTIDLSARGNSPGAIAITNDGDTGDLDETIFVAIFYGQLRPGKTAVDEGQDDQREGRVVAISAATNAEAATDPVAVLSPMADTGFASNGQLAPGVGLVPAVVSTNPQTFTTPTGAFPNQLASIAINPANGRAYVVSTGASPNGPLRFNQMAQGLISVFDVATRDEVLATQSDTKFRRTAPLNMNQGVNLDTAEKPRLFHTNPVAIAWRGTQGKDAWVAIQNSDLVVRLKVDASGIPTVGAPLAAGPGKIVRVDLQRPGGTLIPGKAPRGIAINREGTRAFVSNFVSRSVTMIDIAHPNAPKIISTARSVKQPAAGSDEATLQFGAELFYTGRGPQRRMSSESWGGCIVCHPNGRSDNVTWMFDAGPRQTIPLDATFNKDNPADQRALNWSAVRDENQDFELNTRGVFGGRGIIDDDRLFLAFAGEKDNGDTSEIEQFQQVTGVVGTTNDLTGEALPNVPRGRRDFGIATLEDGRVFIIGGRGGGGNGNLITGNKSIVEFDPLSNTFNDRSNTGFTPRHSLGAAAVRTSEGFRIYAIGGYASDDPATMPASTVQEYNPNTDSWRTVASLPAAVAQFGITVAGGLNTADPRQLIHVVGGNAGSESAPLLVGPTFGVQRFQADSSGPGVWSNFTVTGLTTRRNHGAATAQRGVAARIFVIGGQDAAGNVLNTVEEYTNAAVPAAVLTPHTSLPVDRSRFGITSSFSTNQIYVIGGLDGAGTAQSDIFEYTLNNNGAIAGPPGTPSGSWVSRANLSVARAGLGVSKPSGVTNFLPVANHGRSFGQDAMTAWIQQKVRAARAPVPATDPDAQAGRTLFGTTGLVVAGFSCATCHGGPKWTRSIVDYIQPPSPADNIGLGNENVIGAELRKTSTQPGTFPGVLINVGTFAANSPGGRVNEIRANAADPGQAVAPLGANGFNIPSVLSIAETAPYFYSGLAQTLEETLNGSQDGNGGTRHHFVTDPAQRAQLIQFMRSIDDTTPIFP